MIETKKNSAINQYVQTIRLNCQSQHRLFIPWEKITKGGNMILQWGLARWM
ncbi:MAG: hypothetical protein EOO14_00030 [Chitinophagaceae bacterium]|nr:MAG: hypothetical protein EOO14_00030 [Chitinophagaceae bacterium]